MSKLIFFVWLVFQVFKSRLFSEKLFDWSSLNPVKFSQVHKFCYGIKAPAKSIVIQFPSPGRVFLKVADPVSTPPSPVRAILGAVVQGGTCQFEKEFFIYRDLKGGGGGFSFACGYTMQAGWQAGPFLLPFLSRLSICSFFYHSRQSELQVAVVDTFYCCTSSRLQKAFTFS
jgi:hypothetical protein